MTAKEQERLDKRNEIAKQALLVLVQKKREKQQQQQQIASVDETKDGHESLHAVTAVDLSVEPPPPTTTTTTVAAESAGESGGDSHTIPTAQPDGGAPPKKEPNARHRNSKPERQKQKPF